MPKKLSKYNINITVKKQTPWITNSTGAYIPQNFGTKYSICIENNDSFNIMNFLILLAKKIINKSRSNSEPLYFINFLSFLKEKIENIVYIKTINSHELNGWESDLANALQTE